MKRYSYFFKKGKGTYGLSNEQITKDDLYVNHEVPDLSSVQDLINQSDRLERKIENLQQTVFYNRVIITYDLLEDFSNGAQYSSFPIYYNQANGVGRLIVDTTKIIADFRNTTVFMKDSIESGAITTRNRRFRVLGDPQPAYGNYVWYNCEYVPSNTYAYDILGSYMPNNSTWFLAYQREEIDVNELPAIPEYSIDIIANKLILNKDGVEVDSKDLSLYIDDTNLSRLTSGTVNPTTGIATFTRDDNSTFTVDFSELISLNYTFSNGVKEESGTIKLGALLSENTVFPFDPSGDPRAPRKFTIGQDNGDSGIDTHYSFDERSLRFICDTIAIKTRGNYRLEVENSYDLSVGESSNFKLNIDKTNTLLRNDILQLVSDGAITIQPPNNVLDTSQLGNVLTKTGNSGQSTWEKLPEYSIDVVSNQLKLLKDGVEIASTDLSLYVDDTNLSRLINGSLDSNTGIATFTRDDNTTFTVDFSAFLAGDTSIVIDTEFDETSTNPLENKEITKAINSLELHSSKGKLRYTFNTVRDDFLNLNQELNAYPNTDFFLIFTNTSTNLRFATRKSNYNFLLDDFEISVRGGALSSFESNSEVYNNSVEKYRALGYEESKSTALYDVYEIDRIFGSPELFRYTGTNSNNDYAELFFNFSFMKIKESLTPQSGSFSPTLETTGATYSFSGNGGSYYKIGKMVYFDLFLIQISTVGTPTGTLEIRNLPFPVASTSGLSIRNIQGFSSNFYAIYAQTFPVSDSIVFVLHNSFNGGFNNNTVLSSEVINSGSIALSGTYLTN